MQDFKVFSKIFRIIYFSTYILFLYSCQEIYNPGNLDSSKKIVVINGYITNNVEQYKVSIFLANGFNNKNTQTPITGAKVFLKDNLGNSELLKDYNNGNYYSDTSHIKGIIGNKYYIHVELPDGSIYESIQDLMCALPQVDSIYAEIGKHDAVDKDETGNLLITPEVGLNIKIALNSDANIYCSFNSNVTTQKVHSEITVGALPTEVFCWYNSNLNDIPDIASTLPDGTKYVVMDHNMGFVPLINSSSTSNVRGVTYTPEQVSGWIISTTVSAINADAYTYYQSVNNQLSAQDRIFDPIPSQIIGNIRCISDPSKVALGLFEVSSNITVNEAFSWTLGSQVYHKKKLDSYSIINDNCKRGTPPDFWVNF